MRIVVTGAGGFLAGHLIPALQGRGHEVVGLVCDAGDAERLRERKVDAFLGDVTEPSTLVEPIRNADAVFHLAAAIGIRRPFHEYEAVNVGGTGNVCRAALAARVRRLVHVSTTSVYAQGLGRPVSEDAPLAPMPDPYAVTKAGGDALVRRMIHADGLPATIVRTSTVYGPGDELNFGRIAGRLMRGRAIVIGSGSNRVPFTYVSDVVDGLLLALESDRAVGNVYNVVDADSPSQRQLLDEIATQVGAARARIHVPYRMIYGAAYIAERIAAATGSAQPLVTRFGVALYGADNRFSIEKARRELGYRPQVSLRDGIHRTAQWYRQSRRPSRPVALAGEAAQA